MNKKKLVGGIAAVLLLGAGVAYGIGGSQSDPLISLEYLKETFQPALLQQIDSKVETSVSASYQKVVEKVTQGSSESSVGLTMKTQHRNDTVTLHQGFVILLTAGSATASASHGELVDVTTGTASSQGMLIPGHRYLVGEGATAVVTMFSDTAKLAVEGNSSIHTAGASVTPFTDLSSADWYYSYVTYAYERGLLSGVSADVFAPKTSVTRAMLATILYRLGREALLWRRISPLQMCLLASGIVLQLPGRWGLALSMASEKINLRLLHPLQEKQLAVMLRNYALSYLGQQDPGTGSTESFQDKNLISSWANDSVRWAVGQGILAGRDDGRLDPSGTATRAEVCTILQRFIKACL